VTNRDQNSNSQSATDSKDATPQSLAMANDDSDVHERGSPPNQRLDEFNSYRSPVLFILLLTAPIFLLVMAFLIALVRLFAESGTPAPPGDVVQSASATLFALYLSAFLAMWIVYFKSRRQLPNGSRLRSLRRLLVEFSVNWDDADHHAEINDLEILRREHHNKADKSIVVLAILVAAAIIILVQASNISIGLKAASVPYTLWDTVVLGTCASLAVVSVTCFLISADALDSMFNRFSTGSDIEVENEREARQRLITHFYRLTINPRYFGMVAFLLSLVFIILHHSRPFASFALAIMITVGYRHWFPTIERLREYRDGNRSRVPSWLRWHPGMGIIAAGAALVLEPSLRCLLAFDAVERRLTGFMSSLLAGMGG